MNRILVETFTNQGHYHHRVTDKCRSRVQTLVGGERDLRTGAALPPGKLSPLLAETTGNRRRKYVSLEIRALCVHTHTSREACRDTESARLRYVWAARTKLTTCTKMHRAESIESVTIPLLPGKCSPALLEAYTTKLTMRLHFPASSAFSVRYGGACRRAETED